MDSLTKEVTFRRTIIFYSKQNILSRNILSDGFSY
jgi:hypothetical protein